jgi:pumilio RNA-binding family
MDPSREAELACFFLDAMRFGDPSPAPEHEMLLQQHRHAAPSREQGYGALNRMMQGLQAARQFWPQPAYYPLEEMGSLSRAPAINGGYAPTQSACPYQSVTASSSLSAGPGQCQPAPSAASNSLQHQHCSIANQTVPDYASSIIERLRAIRAQAPAVRRYQSHTLEETRSQLLCSDMELQLVTFPNSAAHVVRLLQVQEEGSERIRHSVLAGATRRVHDLMDDREGREVLAALLRACAGRYAEVRAIVQAAAVAHNPNGRHSLLRLAKHDHGYETKLYSSSLLL